MNYISEINKLRKEKNAIILAHYYQSDDIQAIADYVGDSLALAQWAKKTDADIIVMCGVHFMGETAKILSPNKKVLIPDAAAGCSLADSCELKDLKKFIKEHPGHKVISYVNTTAAVKTVTDVVVTSTNAKQIVESFPKDQKIIFGPDRNLGGYINSITGRNMVLWNGGCHVHARFTVKNIERLKNKYPDALVLTHPECDKSVVEISDYVGSTAGILKFATNSDKKYFIITTEGGIMYKLKEQNSDKVFISASETDSCSCDEICGVCEYMRYNTIEKLYNCLKNESPEILLDEKIIKKAVKPISKMLEISEKLGL